VTLDHEELPHQQLSNHLHENRKSRRALTPNATYVLIIDLCSPVLAGLQRSEHYELFKDLSKPLAELSQPKPAETKRVEIKTHLPVSCSFAIHAP
jgi:hypothetical protein